MVRTKVVIVGQDLEGWQRPRRFEMLRRVSF